MPRDPVERGFASDNYAGAHPEVIAAVVEANRGHATSYGEDPWTARLAELVRQHFGERAVAYPVFTGTAANVLALQSMLPRWGAVICAESSHLNVDEAGAPERVGGVKLLTVPTDDGKLTPAMVDRFGWAFGDVHRATPGVVSVTQTTELGTVYTPGELSALAERTHQRGMRLHVDGARLANAVATLGVPLRALTTDVGVDVVSFGGTKNGTLGAEAVVVLDPAACTGLPHLRKMGMQLASKMRFLSAQLVALLEGDLWLRSATHANAMATLLRASVEALPEVRPTQPTQANGVFAILPPGVADRVRETVRFYDWDAATGEVRWMCSFDTTEDDVRRLVAAVHEALKEDAR